MKNSSLPIFFFVSLLLISISSTVFALQQQTKCNPQDLKIIEKINAAQGVKNPSGSVDCDTKPPYNVIELNFIDDPNISGHIPADIGNLTSLQVLKYYNLPKLTGNIPPSITKLSQLSIFYITQTRVSGPIPGFLAKLPNLKILDLSNNFFSGSIPPELSQSPKLRSLILEDNKLTGTIPESFGRIQRRFKYLLLSRNSLTGPIPKSLGNLNLRNIELAGNKFTGDASFLFGKKKTTWNLYLQENNFSFDLSKVEFPEFILEANLSHNSIFGSLPQQLKELTSLSLLDVSYNKLCGAIPQGGALQSFGIKSYAHNKCLCGSPLQACK